MAEIKNGQLCLFDPENILKLKEKEVFSVKVISTSKKRLFGKSLYNCLNLSNGKVLYNIQGKLLVPIEKYEMEDVHVVVRYPDDIPTITETDIKSIKDILDMLPSGNNDISDRLNMLLVKLEYFNNVNDI